MDNANPKQTLYAAAAIGLVIGDHGHRLLIQPLRANDRIPARTRHALLKCTAPIDVNSKRKIPPTRTITEKHADHNSQAVNIRS
jgi:hypothetical protein